MQYQRHHRAHGRSPSARRRTFKLAVPFNLGALISRRSRKETVLFPSRTLLGILAESSRSGRHLCCGGRQLSRVGITHLTPNNVGTQVFTEGHKNNLDRNRPVARNRHIPRRRCTLSLARPRSMLSFSLPPSWCLSLTDRPTRSSREVERQLTSSSSPIRRFSMTGLTRSAARSSGPSPGSSST